MINDFISSINASQRNSDRVDSFWYQTASMFGIANIQMLLELAEPETANVSSFTALCLEEHYEKLKELSDKMDSSTIAGLNYKCVFSEPEKTRKSTQASLTAMTQPFLNNRQLQNMMSQTTFDMSSIGKKPTVVYVIMADEKDTHHFLVTIFIKQLYECLIKVAQKSSEKSLPIRVNFLLDEFASIPKIDNFANAMAAARSRNIRFQLILQNINQLENNYGKSSAEIIKGNCNNWVFLSSKELPLLNEISALCGSRTSNSGYVKPLITISELQKLKKGEFTEALILSSGHNPYIAELPDISKYKSFEIKKFADNPPKKFGEFKMLDIKSVFNSIDCGLILCPFACQDDNIHEKRAVYGPELIERLYSLVDSVINSLLQIRLKLPRIDLEDVYVLNSREAQTIIGLEDHLPLYFDTLKGILNRFDCICNAPLEIKRTDLEMISGDEPEYDDDDDDENIKVIQKLNSLNHQLSMINYITDCNNENCHLQDLHEKAIEKLLDNIKSTDITKSKKAYEKAIEFIANLSTKEIHEQCMSQNKGESLKALFEAVDEFKANSILLLEDGIRVMLDDLFSNDDEED